ncbi:MAG: hypothetical protein DRO90_02945 [Candidatus Altiarchaeales archaeon]|nr:MAG: hypothetical protein DRO90_02945 [Candidatus Altiarchaeales archaeon]
MRQVCVYDSELIDIKNFFESMLGRSSHGLFYSIGQMIGRNIAREASHEHERFFEIVSKKIKERNFVEEIYFDNDTVTVFGSVEVHNSDHNTCDILRGILVIVYEFYRKSKNKLYCEEIECASVNGNKCVFKIEEDIV